MFYCSRIRTKNSRPNVHSTFSRVPNRFFGILDFPYLRLGIRDLKAKWARLPEMTLWITGLHEILGRDHGIEEPYWGPSFSDI